MAQEVQAAQLLSGELGDISIVDVRSRKVFQLGAIKGSLSVPMDPNTGAFGEEGIMTPSQAVNVLSQLPKDKPVVVVCYRGFLSQRGAELISHMGYEAYSLAGGYQAYQQALFQQ